MFGLIIFCTFIFGCTTRKTRVQEGVYISENGVLEGEFSKMKYIIEEISTDEYNLANGENVFLDPTSYKKPRYLSMKLYLLPSNTLDYELVTITNLKYDRITGDAYTGDAYLKLGDKIYESEMECMPYLYSIKVFELDCVCSR